MQEKTRVTKLIVTTVTLNTRIPTKIGVNGPSKSRSPLANAAADICQQQKDNSSKNQELGGV